MRKLYFTTRERVLTGIKGSNILNLDKGFSLKNIDVLVQDKEAIWVAETCPPMRAICMAKPPTQCATTCIFMCCPCNSRILFIAAKENKWKTDKTLEVTKNLFQVEYVFVFFTTRDIKSSKIFNCEVV